MQINDFVFDRRAKEVVCISNGLSHDDNSFTPTEAIALRVVSVDGDGKPILAFTYRQVDAAALVLVQDQQEARILFQRATREPSRFFRFVGRV